MRTLTTFYNMGYVPQDCDVAYHIFTYLIFSHSQTLVHMAQYATNETIKTQTVNSGSEISTVIGGLYIHLHGFLKTMAFLPIVMKFMM